MSENLINEELQEELNLEQETIDPIDSPVEETIEAPVEEVIEEKPAPKPAKKKKKKKDSVDTAKVKSIIRKRPRTVVLLLENGKVVEVPKVQFDKLNKLVKL